MAVGNFISTRFVDVTKVGGFTAANGYATVAGAGPSVNLNGFTVWAVVDPVKNYTTNNIQIIFAKSGNTGAQGWGWEIRMFQGCTYFRFDAGSGTNLDFTQTLAQAAGTAYPEVGQMQVIHGVVRNNVIYTYKNGVPTGQGAIHPPPLIHSSGHSISIGAFYNQPVTNSPFDGSVIAAGICGLTGLTDYQVTAHYQALLLDPYSPATGATQAWRADQAGDTWTDYIGGLVATKYGTPTITTAKMNFYTAYDYRASSFTGETVPLYPPIAGNIKVMMCGNSITYGADYMATPDYPGSIRYHADMEMASYGIDIEWVGPGFKDGKGIVPTDYLYVVGGSCANNFLNNNLGGTINWVTALNTYQPDVLVLWWPQIGGTDNPTASDMKADLLSLISVAHATLPNCRFLIPGYINAIRIGGINGPNLDSRFKDYNQWLQPQINLLKRQGLMINTVKMEDTVAWDSDADWHLNDPVHLSAAVPIEAEMGYNKLGTRFWPALRRICGYN